MFIDARTLPADNGIVGLVAIRLSGTLESATVN